MYNNVCRVESGPNNEKIRVDWVYKPRFVNVTDEDEYFPPPRNIRELQGAIETASTVMLGGSVLDRPGMDDRSLPASDVLASLAG